ncbi:hypothetical protein F2Q69_00054903, partial [Brassica cretica]
MQEGDYNSYYHHQYPQYPNASPNPNPNPNQSEHLRHQTSAYPPLSSTPAPNPNPPQYSSSLYSAPPYTGGGSSIPPSYEKPYDKGGADRIIYTENDLRAKRLLSAKIIRAVPKADVQEGVQKFCVKLLAETYGQTTTDVLCQIGLDGLRMLDPSTSRTLRIYTLRDAKLQSNSYTANTPLDTVTAAMFQAKEIWGSSRPPVSAKLVPDEAVSKCTLCGSDFGAFNLRDCSQPLTAEENAPQIRVFDRCMAEVSQRLSYAKESASRNVSVQSYGDLARKPATDKSEYDDQNTDEPNSVITQLPHMHAVWSLRSDRAWLELGRYAKLGRYVATELFLNVDTTLVHAFSSTLRCYLPKTVANSFHVSRHSKSSIKLY